MDCVSYVLRFKRIPEKTKNMMLCMYMLNFSLTGNQ